MPPTQTLRNHNSGHQNVATHGPLPNRMRAHNHTPIHARKELRILHASVLRTYPRSKLRVFFGKGGHNDSPPIVFTESHEFPHSIDLHHLHGRSVVGKTSLRGPGTGNSERVRAGSSQVPAPRIDPPPNCWLEIGRTPVRRGMTRRPGPFVASPISKRHSLTFYRTFELFSNYSGALFRA